VARKKAEAVTVKIICNFSATAALYSTAVPKAAKKKFNRNHTSS